MKIYVASHDQAEAKKIASELMRAGHVITSTWLDQPFLQTTDHTEDECREIALRDCEEIRRSDALVLLSQEDECPGGKFVEVGIALGLLKKIVVIGHRENMLMWHPSIMIVNTVRDVLEVLR